MQDEDPVDALRSLELDVEPPATLRPQIVRRLKASGSIRRSQRWGWVVAVAAVLFAVFAAGWMVGRTWERGHTAERAIGTRALSRRPGCRAGGGSCRGI